MSGAPDRDLPPEMAVGRHLAGFVGVEHVAMVLTAGPGYQGVVRGSAPPLVRLVEMGESVGEGPVLDVLSSGVGTAVDDLRAEMGRWPLLDASYPVPDHLRALVVLPLDGGSDGTPSGSAHPEDVVGLLLLARERPVRLPAQALATVVRGASLLAGMVMARAEGDLEVGPGEALDLDALIDPRADVVPRALGVLAEREGLTVVEARGRLQADAFAAGETVHEAARRLLAEDG